MINGSTHAAVQDDEHEDARIAEELRTCSPDNIYNVMIGGKRLGEMTRGELRKAAAEARARAAVCESRAGVLERAAAFKREGA